MTTSPGSYVALHAAQTAEDRARGQVMEAMRVLREARARYQEAILARKRIQAGERL